jgi:hypothetical protein
MTQQTDCGCPPETFTRDGVTYEVEHTDAYVGELGTRWTRGGAQKLANEMNVTRLAPSVRYEVRHKGWFSWAVVALQNKLLPPGTVRDDTPLRARATLDRAEDFIEADLGLPPTWRCACGGKPFVGKECPRCGSKQQ